MEDAAEYEGEYDLILGEDESEVAFQIQGKEVRIARRVLLRYDEEGRFWLSMEDAKALGLTH